MNTRDNLSAAFASTAALYTNTHHNDTCLTPGCEVDHCGSFT